jgi:hypothetical protein
MILTKAQRLSLYKVWRRVNTELTNPSYRAFRRQAQPGPDGCVMIKLAGMWLGIERDGYTHS